MSYLVNSFLSLASRPRFRKQVRNVANYFQGQLNNQIIIFKIFSTTYSSMSSPSAAFKGKTDRYKGIIIDSQEEECDITEFSQKLEDSLQIWRQNENRGIWFKVDLDHSEWVPVLTKKGFKYHHAKEGYVMMFLWLPKTENSNIPHYAHTMLGVGAVVTNDNDQILVVKEKYAFKNIPLYKLPGGYVEPGENIVDGAIREVHEETNITSKFESVLTLRHAHQGLAYNCSDIYIVVHLRALTTDIVKCEREIAESRWMDIKEYLSHPEVTEANKFFVNKYLEHKKHGIRINCFHGIHELINKAYTMYSVTKADMEDHEGTLENLKKKL